MKQHFFLAISELAVGESNGWMLKRSKTGPVYFQLKETFWGGRWSNITHTHTHFHGDLGQMGHANGWSYVLGGGAKILHTHIHFHGDLGQRGHTKGPS